MYEEQSVNYGDATALRVGIATTACSIQKGPIYNCISWMCLLDQYGNTIVQ
jgi:hypothetical protein